MAFNNPSQPAYLIPGLPSAMGNSLLVGTDASSNLAAISVVPLQNGGTNANLTASNGGIVYSAASAFAVLSGTATAGQMLRSGSSGAPSWSTATFPSTATSTGTILRADGTNWVATTATYPTTTTANQLLYSSATNTVEGLTSANTSALVTNNTGVPSFTSGTTANRLLRTNGTTVSFAQAALTTDVTGTLPVGNGGTGTNTTFTTGSVVFAGTSGVYSQNNSKLFWDNTNERLGVGLNSPTLQLDTLGAPDTTFSPNIINMRLRGTASATSGNAGGGISFAGYTTGTTGANDLAFISGIKENATDTNYDGALVFGCRTNGSGGGNFERMRITSAGNVLINTTTIGTLLTVNGVATLCSGTATPAGGSTSARLLFGTTAGFGIYYGSGLPTVSAAQGSIYLRSDGSSTSTRLYVNTNGSTTWTNVTTAA